tara:strand:- start:1380 stop:1604 length:225 start_codon:yes stop_codon:yes gene_type:complete
MNNEIKFYPGDLVRMKYARTRTGIVLECSREAVSPHNRIWGYNVYWIGKLAPRWETDDTIELITRGDNNDKKNT